MKLFAHLLLLVSLFTATSLKAEPLDSFADSQNKLLQRLEKLDQKRQAQLQSLSAVPFQDQLNREDLEAKPHSRMLPLPKQISTLRDIAYGPHPQQQFNLYLPLASPSSMVKTPIILFVHGGPLTQDDRASMGVYANKVAHWVPKGYAVAIMNYRAVGFSQKEVIDDINSAISTIQNRAMEWNIDTSKLVLMSHSAGAYYTSLLITQETQNTSHKTSTSKPWIGTILLDNPGYDIQALINTPHPDWYHSFFKKTASSWQSVSALYRLQSFQPPMLLVCSKTRLQLCIQAETFTLKAQQLGSRTELMPETLTHNELNSELGLNNRYTQKIDRFLNSLGLP